MRAFSLILALLASMSANGTPLSSRTTSPPPTTQIVYQFPNETWLENIAIRQTGQLLVTVLSAPELWQVTLDPKSSQHALNANTSKPLASATLVHRIPDVTGLLGIVEMQPDMFYVVAGNYSYDTYTSTSGSYSIWKINMRRPSSPAVASKLTDIPEGVALNGMAALNMSPGLLVVADAGAGVVYTVNVDTGNYSKTIDDPTMKPNSSFAVGINGMKIRDEYLYYTSTAQKLFSRIPIDTTSGTPTGPAEIIATNVFGDDFSLDQAGDAYVAENLWDVVAKVTSGGEVSVVAGSLHSTLVAGATSTAFERTSGDGSVLYVTTSGGIGTLVRIEGGKVVAIYI
ncbi:hypothetical protein PILCRDRAFT_825950 [Piloderma croceum F 1598]|uniref:SMP-30/Gluconolactonase/LRE-like region domain-containing protein n=1 Tax=Piloderma croceum (strain F 1598) TaxID=765440 RepID=A0A0C3BHT6_PILCF|nr:hypothetical protein PILCRDRAFT_825950 [Piloderma croceum F 1598]